MITGNVGSVHGAAVCRTTLPNGFRLVTEAMPHSCSVTVGAWVVAGSRHERAGEGGTAHFVEHLLFKGTATRSARQLAETIDAVGGDMNAYTTKEYTCCHIRVLAEHLPLALELLADIVLNSRFAAADMDLERAVILEEIRAIEDTPDDLVHDLLAASLWGNGPLGRPVIGTAATVAAASRQQILNFYDAHYRPERTVLAAAGCLDPALVAAQVEELFGSWRPGGPIAAGAAIGAPAHREIVVNAPARMPAQVWVKTTEQVHFCLGRPGLAADDDDLYSLILLSGVLGGGPSSRLFQSIREERGLAYSIYSYHAAFSDTGLFGIYAGTSPAAAGRVLTLIEAELASLRQHGITTAELDRGKAQLKSSLLMDLEANEVRMAHLGRSELLLGKVLTPAAIMARIEALTGAAVAAVAARWLDPAQFVLAAVAPTAAPFALQPDARSAGRI